MVEEIYDVGSSCLDKVLCGTLDAGEKQNLTLAIDHDTRETVAQARQCGT